MNTSPSKDEGPVNGAISLDEYHDLLQRGDVDTIICAAPDPYGRLVGKRLTTRAFQSLCLDGDGVFASSFIFAVDLEMNPLELPVSNADNGYVDIRLVPDMSTLRRVPWEQNTILVICDAYGAECDDLISVAPRTILRRQIEQARQQGIALQFASELEFFLAEATHKEAWKRGYQGLQMFSSYRSDYQMGQAGRTEWFIRQLRNNISQFGVPIESSKPEWGLGQQEITIDYAGALEMADRHVLFKYAVKELAYREGLTPTFMAKPTIDEVGSSCHLHISLWHAETGEPLDWGPSGGMSQVFGNFVAGQLEHALDLGLMYAPTINSYKRFQPDQFAGTAIAVGRDNRSCAFRLVGHGASFRVENRIPGADVNPYYAYAASIIAGLDGVARRLSHPKVFEGNAWHSSGIRTMSTSFHHSLQRFEECVLARDSFGTEVYEHLLESARAELTAFDSGTVNDWETRRYYERV